MLAGQRKITTAAQNGDQFDFELFSIGGGSGGVRAARYSASLGVFRISKAALLPQHGMQYAATDVTAQAYFRRGTKGGLSAKYMCRWYDGMLYVPGAKVGLCELPRAFISSDEAGGTGGTCILRGCVPKKLMALGGLFAEDVQNAASFGCALFIAFQTCTLNSFTPLVEQSPCRLLICACITCRMASGCMVACRTVSIYGGQVKEPSTICVNLCHQRKK